MTQGLPKGDFYQFVLKRKPESLSFRVWSKDMIFHWKPNNRAFGWWKDTLWGFLYCLCLLCWILILIESIKSLYCVFKTVALHSKDLEFIQEEEWSAIFHFIIGQFLSLLLDFSHFETSNFAQSPFSISLALYFVRIKFRSEFQPQRETSKRPVRLKMSRNCKNRQGHHFYTQEKSWKDLYNLINQPWNLQYFCLWW